MNSIPLKPVLSALFTALIIVGAYISIPVPGLPPVVLAVFFLFLGGLILGPLWAVASGVVYLSLGVLGLGVFAGGAGGIAQFSGPTGGFLLGYVLALLVTGLLADRKNYNFFRNLLAVLAGGVALYAVGLPWLQMSMPSKFSNLWAVTMAMSPYMVGDLIKAFLAVGLVSLLKPLLKTYFPQGK